MTYQEAIAEIKFEYGNDLLVALENIQAELNNEDNDLEPTLIEAYNVAMGGFSKLFNG